MCEKVTGKFIRLIYKSDVRQNRMLAFAEIIVYSEN